MKIFFLLSLFIVSVPIYSSSSSETYTNDSDNEVFFTTFQQNPYISPDGAVTHELTKDIFDHLCEWNPKIITDYNEKTMDESTYILKRLQDFFHNGNQSFFQGIVKTSEPLAFENCIHFSKESTPQPTSSLFLQKILKTFDKHFDNHDAMKIIAHKDIKNLSEMGHISIICIAPYEPWRLRLMLEQVDEFRSITHDYLYHSCDQPEPDDEDIIQVNSLLLANPDTPMDVLEAADRNHNFFFQATLYGSLYDKDDMLRTHVGNIKNFVGIQKEVENKENKSESPEVEIVNFDNIYLLTGEEDNHDQQQLAKIQEYTEQEFGDKYMGVINPYIPLFKQYLLKTPKAERNHYNLCLFVCEIVRLKILLPFQHAYHNAAIVH